MWKTQSQHGAWGLIIAQCSRMLEAKATRVSTEQLHQVKPHNCATTIQQWVQWVTGVCVCAQWITYCGCGCVKEWWADSGFQMPSGLCSWSVFSEPALFCVDDGYHWHSQTDMHIQYTGIGTGPADPTAAIAIIWQTRIFMVTLYQLLWMWNEQKHKQKKMHTLWSTDSQEH